jgi:hypothetical protein
MRDQGCAITDHGYLIPDTTCRFMIASESINDFHRYEKMISVTRIYYPESRISHPASVVSVRINKVYLTDNTDMQ